ncbi:hypothetical protein GC087_07265 [Pantoea sp. JZ2]|uniref:virion core protein, T7 gp14 family n=1 Tax=Pantoea sp. JZ2 TaxID=2654189 RepID=UPI002B482C59|nr:hypothetical protein [Pantoea sp. JZ2]WRH12433.1 hypothetical protein GC087_07265 [Pantoea sp. JZ2]
MCGPVAIGVAMLAATAASAYSQRQQSKYQSELANYNADLQEKSADAAINAGNAQADQMRARARQLSGTQAATMAASGVDLGGGTAVDIFGDTAQMGELDALTTVNNAKAQAYGLQTQAAGNRSQASALSSFGNQQAGMTLLNGALGAYSGYTSAGGKSPFSSSSSVGGSTNSSAFGGLKSSRYGSNSFTF